MATSNADLLPLDARTRRFVSYVDELTGEQVVALHGDVLDAVTRHLEVEWSVRRRGGVPTSLLVTVMLETACVYSGRGLRNYRGESRRTPALERVMDGLQSKLVDRADAFFVSERRKPSKFGLLAGSVPERACSVD